MSYLRPSVIKQVQTHNQTQTQTQHYFACMRCKVRHNLSCINILYLLYIPQKIFLVQVRLRTEVLRTPKFDPTEVRTHDLQIMTVHSMSLRPSFLSLFCMESNASLSGAFAKTLKQSSATESLQCM